MSLIPSAFRRLVALLRRSPRRTVVGLALLLLAGSALGFGLHARNQWRGAQEDASTGQLDRARSRIAFCLWLWPQNAEVHLLAARIARLQGEFKTAEDHLNQCKKLQRGATEALQIEFLFLRVQTGDVDEVASPLLKLVDEKHPQSLLILETLCRAYMHNLRCGPALNGLARWMELAPEAATPYHWRGWVMERLNNVSAARADYERALELDPDLFAARLRVAEMFLEDSNPPAALPHLQRLQQQAPNRASVQARLGQCRLMQGFPEEARPLMEAAVKEMPDDPSLLVHLAKLEIQEGHPAEAEPWLKRVLAKDPYDAEAEYTLFECMRLQGRQDEAAKVLADYEKHKLLLKRAHELLKEETINPTPGPKAPSEVGRTFLSIGQERLGIFWLHQALERDANHKPTHEALAEHYEKKGDADKAASHRRRAAAP